MEFENTFLSFKVVEMSLMLSLQIAKPKGQI